MVDDHGQTNEQIAKSCGKTAGFVSQHLSVLKAPKKLQAALSKGVVGISVFRYFGKLDLVRDKVFYDKLVEAALAGVPGNKIDDQVAKYLERKTQKAATQAAKTGAAPPKAAKKGAAAHKKGAQLVVRDYTDAAVQKAVKMVPKATALERLVETAAKLQRTTRAARRAYLEGVLDGMEEFASLVEVTKD
jgi:hypothetical protein